MRIAVLRETLDNFGGSERLSVILAKHLNADLISTSIDENIIKNMGFNAVRAKSIGSIPFNDPFRQWMGIYKFRKLNISKNYDFFIIVGPGALSAAVNHRPILWYADTPSRRVWDLYKYTKKSISPFLRGAFIVWAHYHRYLDKKYINRIENIIAISRNVQKRIKAFFNKESTVIHPPIDAGKYYYRENGDFWLSVNRIVDHKRLDLQMEVFRKLPSQRLVTVGCYEKSLHFQKYIKYIYKTKPQNITLLKNIPEDKLIDLYSRCKGLLATAKDEDFGMTPVEAMASGKPVVAVSEGGYKETVINHVTGELVNADKDDLICAINKVSINPEKYKDACQKRAREFDINIFMEKIKEQIKI